MDLAPDGETRTADVSTLVLKIVGEMSGAVDVKPENDLVADLCFDSLGLVELFAVLEDTFCLPAIDIEALGKIDKVADVQKVVQEARAGPLAMGTSE